jgi:hypothetical protein
MFENTQYFQEHTQHLQSIKRPKMLNNFYFQNPISLMVRKPIKLIDVYVEKIT